jgi:hypothetical protein
LRPPAEFRSGAATREFRRDQGKLANHPLHPGRFEKTVRSVFADGRFRESKLIAAATESCRGQPRSRSSHCSPEFRSGAATFEFRRNQGKLANHHYTRGGSKEPSVLFFTAIHEEKPPRWRSGARRVFGLFHAYQGWKNVGRHLRSVLRVLYGVLAASRRNLRANIVVRAWTDVWGGLVEVRDLERDGEWAFDFHAAHHGQLLAKSCKGRVADDPSTVLTS